VINPIPTPASAAATVIPFAPTSSAVSPTAQEAIKAFAAKRGGGSIVVTGYGDAISSDPGAQTAALSLALTRAQAVANALAAAGVPQTVIRVGAEAGGRGVGLRLLQ
jgi:outer membrane protein OmpA-like peptidoglycan-associated protein